MCFIDVSPKKRFPCRPTFTLTGARSRAFDEPRRSRARPVRRAVLRHAANQAGCLLNAARESTRSRRPQGSEHSRSRDGAPGVAVETAESRRQGKSNLSPSSYAIDTGSSLLAGSAGENSSLLLDAGVRPYAGKVSNRRTARDRDQHRPRTSPSHSDTNRGTSASWRITPWFSRGPSAQREDRRLEPLVRPALSHVRIELTL